MLGNEAIRTQALEGIDHIVRNSMNKQNDLPFTVEKDGGISLTEAGQGIAEKIYARHTLLTKLLIHIGVSEETAAEDACKLEHSISDESFEAIRRYMEHHL